jgi:ribosomal-protein-serine acetyltransferase
MLRRDTHGDNLGKTAYQSRLPHGIEGRKAIRMRYHASKQVIQSMQPIVVDAELELRLLTAEHAPELFAVTDVNRAHLREWLPWLDGVRVVSDSAAFIAKAHQAFAETRGFIAGMWWRNRLVGVIGHNQIDWANRITHIGYWLAADAQGHGIVTRSCRAVIQHAFVVLELNRIEICTAVGNHRSEAIPSRLGFSREGIRREGEWLHNRFIDLTVHAMLKSMWRLRAAVK